MKFSQFSAIRESLVIEGLITESVKSYKEYSDVFYQKALESTHPEYYNNINPFEGLEVDLFGLAMIEDSSITEKEGSGSNVFKNIIGFMRIKGLAGKYMKSMVDEAIADMDYARRKKAAGPDAENKDNAEQLKTAHAAKKEAIKDRTKAIAEKIDNIASTEFLKKVATRTKIAARIKKNEIVLRIASKEEAKELKLKNGELSQDLQRIDGELRDYEKENAEEIDDAKKEAAKQIKEKITDITGKIKEVRKEITDAEAEIPEQENESTQFEAEGDPVTNDQQTADDEAAKLEVKKARLAAYKTIMPLKVQIAKLYDERSTLKQSYNEATGEEEYDVESDVESAENAARDAKDYEKKAEKLETEVGESGKGDKEENTEDQQAKIEAAQKKVDDANNKVKAANEKLDKLKNAKNPEELGKNDISDAETEVKNAEAELAAATKELEAVKSGKEAPTPEEAPVVDETPAAEEAPDDEAIKAAEKEIETAKGTYDKAVQAKNDAGDDETKKAEADKAAKTAKIALLDAKIKKATIEKDEEAIKGFKAEIEEIKASMATPKPEPEPEAEPKESAKSGFSKKAMTFEEFRNRAK